MRDPRERSAEADEALARTALAQGDLASALHHVGCALTHDPMNPDRMAMLGQIIAAAPDPLWLVERGAATTFVDVANKAYVLAWLRRWPEALDLITDVAELRPDIPYMSWCEWWMMQPGVMQSMSIADVVAWIVTDILKIAKSCPLPTPKDDPRFETLESGARILAAFRALHPNEPMLWSTSSLIARRVGDRGEALACAHRAYHLVPSFAGAVAVAGALRDDQRIDEATQWYRRALGHDRKDVTAHLDLGDMFLEAGRVDEATREYESAVTKEEDQPWATASLLYLRHQRTGEAKPRVELLRLTESDPPNLRARALYDKLDPPRRYGNHLPAPADASATAVDAIVDQMFQNPMAHHGATLRLRLAHVESPSVIAAFWLQLEMWGPQVTVDYQVDQIQSPDPRQSKAQVPFTVWQWDGTQPQRSATVARPLDDLSRALAAIANEPFALDIWTPLAADAARALAATDIPGLLSSLVFPPRPPGATWRVLPWVQRVQIAAALVIAHVDPRVPWTGSPRQQALYGLLYGPSDWTTTAAIVALGVLARQDAAIRAEVLQAFTWMQSLVPATGPCAWALPLVATWRHLPDLDAATALHLADQEQRLADAKPAASSVLSCRLDPPLGAVLAAASLPLVPPPIAAADPDPVVFPGQPIARLSDYVGLMQAMQTGNMHGALAQYGLDMTAYAAVTAAWTQRLGLDPTLNGRYAQLMAR
jgi:hypothetical protein